MAKIQKVQTQHPSYSDHLDRWGMCRDFTEGSQAVKDAGQAYLPKLSGHEDSEYLAYKDRAQLYNATGRTVDALTGLVMRIDPTVEVPRQMEEMLEDADYAGTSLFEFARNQVAEVTCVGRSGILVDMPSKGEDIITVAQAQANGLRPYFAHYAAEAIVNWRTARVNGTTILTMVVLKESYEVPDPEDEFIVEQKPQYRVLDLDEAGKYRQRVFRSPANDGDFEQWDEDIYPLKRNQKMDRIPFVFIGVETNTPDIQKSPIADLVEVNLGHYRNSASHEHGLHFTGVPTPVITGHHIADDEVIAIGSETFLVLDSPEAKAFFLEFNGSGLEQVRDAMREKKQEMATLGARMLMQEKAGVEAADTARIHRSGEGGVLGSLAGSVSKAIKRALRIAEDWLLGTETSDFDLNRDFLPMGMDAGLIKVLLESWQSGAISHEVLFENLKRGEVIRDDVNLEDMKKSITDELPGAQPDLGEVPGAE